MLRMHKRIILAIGSIVGLLMVMMGRGPAAAFGVEEVNAMETSNMWNMEHDEGPDKHTGSFGKLKLEQLGYETVGGWHCSTSDHENYMDGWIPNAPGHSDCTA